MYCTCTDAYENMCFHMATFCIVASLGPEIDSVLGKGDLHCYKYVLKISMFLAFLGSSMSEFPLFSNGSLASFSWYFLSSSSLVLVTRKQTTMDFMTSSNQMIPVRTADKIFDRLLMSRSKTSHKMAADVSKQIKYGEYTWLERIPK